MQELFSKTVKILSIIIFVCTISQNVSAQIGITGTYTTIDAPNWQQNMFEGTRFDFSNDFRWDSSIKLGVDYHFKLPEYRIEFLPGVFYAGFKQDAIFNNTTAIESTAAFKVNIIDASFNTNIYFLDIEGDCNCPTFSKDGSVMKKGLFFQVSPGLTYTQNQIIQSITGSELATNYTDVSANLGIGLGVDIGLSDFLTITPLVRFKRHFNVEWELLHFNLSGDPQSSVAESDPNDISPINQFEAGLRVEFRWKD